MGKGHAIFLAAGSLVLGVLLCVAPAAAQSSGHPTGVADTACGPWDLAPTPMPVIPMDEVTVYGFSQSNCGESDPQLLDFSPDISIRTWGQWDLAGTRAGDYNTTYVPQCHARKILFIGGLTATVLFADQFPPDEFDRIVTRDASGAIVNHGNIVPGAHRGSLASPEYRAYLEMIGKLQIDQGADGLFFDEVDQGYSGEKYDNNEGFDDYHLADFNSYLLAKYPPGTDFEKLFKMLPGNTLRRDLPPGDLRRNFNYLRYLDFNGWSRNPFSPDNPLAAEWGRSYDDHPEPGCKTFVSASEPYRYFGRIVKDLKDYTWNKYHRRLLITANGILPNVDFESIGLWDYNHDGDNGSMADYVPVLDGHLNGKVSLQSVFKRFYTQSAVLAPGAPVALFLDWPTGNMNRYIALPAPEREDYWRLYAAEAYANGLFFAFHLKTTTGEPTAQQQGMMPFLKTYSSFYRSHADLYHHQVPSDAAVTISAPHVMTAVWDQPRRRRVLAHLVNHNYDKGFRPQDRVTLTLALPQRPTAVTEESPDLPKDRSLDFHYADGKFSVVLPKLTAYSVVVVQY